MIVIQGERIASAEMGIRNWVWSQVHLTYAKYPGALTLCPKIKLKRVRLF